MLEKQTNLNLDYRCLVESPTACPGKLIITHDRNQSQNLLAQPLGQVHTIQDRG